MKVILGRDATIFFKKGENYVPYGCLETVEINISTETKSVKTINDGMWSKPRAQKHSYSITGSGIVQYDDDTRVNQFDLIDYQIQGVPIEYMMTFKKNDSSTDFQMIYGLALPVSSTLAAPNDFVNSSFELQGVGAPNMGLMPTCAISIPANGYTLVRQGLTFIYKVTIMSTTGGAPKQYDWRLDGAEPKRTEQKPSWSFNLADISRARIYGSHTLEIWPVCDNGAYGNKVTRNFTVPFG